MRYLNNNFFLRLSATMLLLVVLGLQIHAREKDEVNDEQNTKLFVNQKQLSTLFDKLYLLETGQINKINIVHIGDSHIQAGFFTGTIRNALQEYFGDGGIGLTFPYNLAKTNGPKEVKYTSNIPWESYRNVKPKTDVQVGLSGIALYTSNNNFVLQLSTENICQFNKIKVLYPTEGPEFKMTLSEISFEKQSVNITANKKPHKIKAGESLSSIARKYKTTVSKLKSTNNLKSDKINIGNTLFIPGTTTTQSIQTKLDDTNLDYLNLISRAYCSTYSSPKALDRISILANGKKSRYTLNGIVLEKTTPGILYHSIGVNGAHLGDYNKYPIFFKQLPALEADLIILSFGTNESFGRMSAAEYMQQLNTLIDNIKAYNKDAAILIMTTPPSMFNRRRENRYVIDYSMSMCAQNKYAVWDLFTNMGGSSSIVNGQYAELMARDKVHYTKAAYELQGYMFSNDFLNAYRYYKTHKAGK